MAERFGDQVSRRVREYLQPAVLRKAHRRLHRKAAIMAAWYVGSYLLILFGHGWVSGALACTSLTLALAAVGFNVQHDANHNAFVASTGTRSLSTGNRVAGWSMYAIGGNARRWIEGHVVRHHSAPNVTGKDDDIDKTPFARLAPAQPRRPWHAYQQYYVWVLYAFTTAAFIVGDVVSVVKEAITRNRSGRRPKFSDYASLTVSKALFIGALVVVPAFMHPWWIVVLGIGCVLAASGLLLGIVFQLAHAVEEPAFADSRIPRDVRWHEWQVSATVDFCHGAGPVPHVITWYIGGLNYQIEHHLFPDVPHTAYPQIAPIVEATSREFGIPYNVQPSLRAAVRSHFRHLRALGGSTEPFTTRLAQQIGMPPVAVKSR